MKIQQERKNKGKVGNLQEQQELRTKWLWPITTMSKGESTVTIGYAENI